MSDPTHYGDATSVIAQTGLTPDMLAGIDTDADLTEFVESELSEASDEINRFCNRTFFEPREHTETREGNGTDTIQLRHYPVTSIASVERNGTELTEGDDYRLKERRNFGSENKGILKRLGRRRNWRKHTEYTIEYSAGYDSPPPAVAGVAEDLVIAGMREAIVANASAEQGGAQSVSMDGFSVTYDVPGALRSGDITEERGKRLRDLKQLAVA